MTSVLPAPAPLRRVGASGKQDENGDMFMRISNYHRGFASCRMPKRYARKAWKRFNDTCDHLTDSLTLDKQIAFMMKKSRTVAVEPEATTAPAVGVDGLLAVSEDGNSEIRVPSGLNNENRVGVKRKLRELQKHGRAKRRKRL